MPLPASHMLVHTRLPAAQPSLSSGSAMASTTSADPETTAAPSADASAQSFLPFPQHLRPTSASAPHQHQDFYAASSQTSHSSTGSTSLSLQDPSLPLRQHDRAGIRLRKPSSYTHFRNGSNGSAWSATNVNVRRKSHDPSSPVTSTSSFTSTHPSPALSTMASFADSSMMREQNRGRYEEGDSIGEYTLVRELGTGAFSRVFEAVVIQDADTDNEPRPGPGFEPESNLESGASDATNSASSQKRVAMKIIIKPDDPEKCPPSMLESLSFTQSPEFGTPCETISLLHSSIAMASAAASATSSAPTAANAHRHPSDSNLLVVQAQLDKETSLWARLHHAHILEMTDVIDVDDATIIVCELAKGGNLLQYIP
eukprot:jgi/Hompol1/5945/HPOL_000910-RA